MMTSRWGMMGPRQEALISEVIKRPVGAIE
jgi:hypothetical protein